MSSPLRTLVTGATGLVGRHLTERLLARGGSVYLLVRAWRMDAHRERLQELAAIAEGHGAQLNVIDGDVTEPGLDLSRDALATLAVGQLDHVFHVAGHYDLAAGDAQLRAVNVEGTRNVLAWLVQHGFRGVMHHLSSIAVAGDFDGLFTEGMLEAKQQHQTEYHRTKYEAERLVRAESRVRHRIYRPGAVVGHSETGEMDRIDGPYYLFQAIHGARDNLPRWITLPGFDGGRVAMVPVDFVADAIDAIAHRPELDGKTFHIVDPEPPSFRTTFNLIADAAGAPRMGKLQLGRLAEFLPGGKNVIGQLGSVRFMRAHYLEAMGIPPIVAQAQNKDVAYDTENMRSALEGTGIACPPQEQYVEALWDYYLRHLDPKRDPVARDRKVLAGKVMVITGGSSGIGEALARYCGALGATLVLVARREEELARVTAEITEAGGKASFVVADLSDLAACDRAIAVALERHRHIDILINNAGRSIRRPLAESLERFHDLERTMQLNYFGPARLIRGVLPGMRERKTGVIVNVLSVGSNMAAPRFGAYTASKAALGQLGDSLSAEHLHEGIRVMNAYLPWVRTAMVDAKYDEVRQMSPEEAAKWIISGIVERKNHLVQPDVRRRFILSKMRPEGLHQILNLVYRIYADDPQAHPELDLDRMVLKRFVKGRLM